MTSPAALGHDRDTAQVDYRVLGALAATCGDSRLELRGETSTYGPRRPPGQPQSDHQPGRPDRCRLERRNSGERCT